MRRFMARVGALTSAAPVTVGFVGAGAMASEHARAFSDIAGVRIAGIHGRTQAKAEAFAVRFGAVPVYDSVAELFDRARPQLVVVAVGETSIGKVLGECLRFPWTIFMEKPVGIDLAEGRMIEATARRAGVRVLVGLNRRFLSSTLAARDGTEDDASPRFIHVQDQQSLVAARAIGHPAEVVENWMYANSIHLVDYLTLFGRGDVVAVERVNPWRQDDPGIVLAKVAFSSGDLGLYEGIWSGPGPWACSVSTAARRWEMRPLEQATFQNAGERTLTKVEPHVWDGAFKPGFRRQAAEVIAALRGEASAIPDVIEAMRSMQLVHDIFAN
jgi:predicted dehydrogenase